MRKIALTILAAILCLSVVGCAATPAEPPAGEWGIIDSEGNFVSGAHFADADAYGFADNGLAAVRDSETWLVGYVREDGSWAIEPSYPDAYGFADNGLAEACDHETRLWGYIDETGAWVIEPRFEREGPFLDGGVAHVNDGDGGHWIDESGNFVDDGSVSLPRVMKDEASGLYGVVGEDGAWLLEPSYSGLVRDLYSDLYVASPAGSDLWGVIDPSGQWLLEPRYVDLLNEVDADVFAAKDAETGLWGYVRPDGTWAVQPSFAGLTRMSDDGRALARVPGE